MNCPFHIEIYKKQLRSYRDLPLRSRKRDSLSLRAARRLARANARARFTQDDAHIFCRPDQVGDEIRRALDFSLYICAQWG